MQTQAFNCLYETDDNTLVCAPSGSGTLLCAEFAMLRLWNRSPAACAVFVAPVPTSCDRVFQFWRRRFGTAPGGLGKNVVRLTGDDLVDVKLLSSAQLVVADPQQWDKVSRRWKQRKAVREGGCSCRVFYCSSVGWLFFFSRSCCSFFSFLFLCIPQWASSSSATCT